MPANRISAKPVRPHIIPVPSLEDRIRALEKRVALLESGKKANV